MSGESGFLWACQCWPTSCRLDTVQARVRRVSYDRIRRFMSRESYAGENMRGKSWSRASKAVVIPVDWHRCASDTTHA
jgi:hypothetical protein